ncbi:beta-N-acetylglucosaminidase [Streptomyces sp. NRRL F-4489]|uniref:beta-N-acetylhexosaminidase n=1 Tax=Streptomyces sp. NRRL F-4489 TaxID=1609095 RepID=UPI00074B22CD|nr:glycoside hydrolase family 20 protein [Streptomyces sp. NRRL F-4489]KUL37473.1 beta-N-acetylglucosaminidase [Streptomyces sp. NRRL F-4489]
MSNPMRPPHPPRPSAPWQPPSPAGPPAAGREGRTGRTGPAGRRALPAVAALATALALGGCGQGADSRPPGAAPSSSSPAAPIPSWAKVTGPPRVVPAVRDFRPATGNGWRPAKGARIVVPAGEKSSVADEAQLMAKDLGGLPIAWGQQDVRPGDIEIKLTGPANRPDNAPATSTADESYTLTARGGRLTLAAPTDAGVFYATRTVKQAVRTAGGLPEGTVQDRPDRAERGMMLDNARKPFTADWIEARIRQLADLKLNQLQLHFSDDQGFRIQSDSHPQIVSADHLTKDQVRHLIKVGQSLHVTLIPEIDSPGHLGAVLDHYPDLQLRNASGKVLRGAIDISKPQAGALVDALLKEYAQLFPGPYWHLGGDEYQALTVRNPEASYPQLARAARDKYGSGATIKDLATGWLNDRQKTVQSAGKTRIEAWNDGFFADGKVAADKNRTAAYWTGKEIGARDPAAYLGAGRNVLNLNDEYLYYVLGEPNNFTYPTGERIYKSWTPRVLRGTAPVAVPQSDTGPDRIPGARFAIWCDRSQAQTPDQIAAGIKAPLAALAQKTWDPRTPALSWPDFKALVNRL